MRAWQPGSLLRFQLNSTVTSDGGVLKLGKDLWHHSESLQAKIVANEKQYLNAVLRPALIGRALIFYSAKQSATENNHLLYSGQISIARSQRYVLDSKFSVLTLSHLTEVDYLLDER